MTWADSIHWREILAHPGARRNKALHARLHHLHLVQTYYAHVLLGREPFLTEPRNFRTVADLARYGRKSNDQIVQAWAASAGRLQHAIRLAHTDPPRELTRAEAFLQVALHSVHHRGQNAMHMRRLKLEPETVDYVQWVWQGRPAADWTFLDQ